MLYKTHKRLFKTYSGVPGIPLSPTFTVFAGVNAAVKVEIGNFRQNKQSVIELWQFGIMYIKKKPA